ncbi:MAG: TonB-dependent receptor, partial [Burkholderiales bacterium]|nr:TonB-dependent receptor [Burkholderiales bacterium]
MQRIEYRKGPYFAKNGDFAAAGSADIVYRHTLEQPFAALTLGQDQYRRFVGGGSAALTPDMQLLAAIELQGANGPWTVAERLRKRNGVLTLSGGTAAEGYSASLMSYHARWTSTDQVPERLIAAGSHGGQPFGRFDSLDPSDGGRTARSSLSGEWHRQAGDGLTRVAAYAIDYRLKLFSNFTYFLDHDDEGDQFSQQDRRKVHGLNASQTFAHTLGGLPARSEVGLQLRHDRIRVGLFDTTERVVTATTRDDQVSQTLTGVYGQTSLELTPALRAVLGL